jgi:hypothetical protein
MGITPEDLLRAVARPAPPTFAEYVAILLDGIPVKRGTRATTMR